MVFTGTRTAPNFIFAVSIVSTALISNGWATGVGANGTDGSGAGSALPSGLTDDVTALSFNQPATGNDNAAYTGSTTAAAKEGWQSRIHDYLNWTFNDAPPIPTPPTGSFAVTAPAAPEINIQGNGNSIVDGDAAPSATDHTDFGTTPVCNTTIVRTFTIENTGTEVLNISSVNISGTNAADFSVTVSPAASVAVSGATTFQVTFNPSASGARNAVITVNNNDSDESAYDFAVTGTGTNMTITPASQTNVACNGGSNGAAAANAATGGTGAYTYNWTPGNPTGDGTTAVLGLTAGTWTITATDANGCTASTSFTVTQPTALDMTLASKTDVSVYGGSNGAASFNPATGGAGGYTYNWTPGNPTGDGTVSVTGLTAGTWGCTVTDANSCAMYKEVTIIQPPAVTSSDASSVTADSTVIGGNASADGGSAVTERGVVYSDTDATPSIGEPGVIQDANGSGTGAFSETVSGLDPNKTYYYQAYAVNTAGTTYGGVKNFTTLKGTPEVTEWPLASMVTYGDALSASTLDGGSASVPGTFDFKAPETVLNSGFMQTVAVIFTPDSGDYNTVEGTVTIDVDTAELTATADDKSRNFGEENPSFTITYSGFVNGDNAGDINSAPSTSTYATADSPAGEYEIKVSGGSDDNYTFFYESGTLTVNAVMPSATTAAAVNITSGSVRTGGTVTYDGGGVTEKGVCYGESEDPDITGDCVKAVSLSDTFKSALTGLEPLTHYYFRAYATNAAGTAYGEQLDFTTLDAEVMIPAYELPVGAVVYDDTWEYDGAPLEWRVVNGEDTGNVTLSSTTGVGAMAYIAGGWNNKWPDSTMKVWLNTAFYGDFSPAFEDKVLDTEVPWVNTSIGGTVTDKVFIASKTELGGDARNGDGTVLDWFSDQITAPDRRGDVVCDPAIYWTRTGELGTHNSQWYEMSADYVFVPAGDFVSGAWSYDVFDTVPVVNISSDTMFELIEGKYRLFIAEPLVTFSADDIIYGQKAGDSSLSASTAEYEGSPVAGTFSFDEPDNAFDADTYSVPVTFTPDDLVNYRIVKGSVTLNVKKAVPVITWENPEDIVYGTVLDGAQLNATADVSGTFVYSPDAGEVMNAGYSQTLRADFTPDGYPLPKQPEWRACRAPFLAGEGYVIGE